jgi:hypothetical protein
VRNPSYRRIFDRSFWISFFSIAIVSWILSYGTTSVAHKLGLAGTNIEFGLVLGGSVASIFIASKLVKIVTAYGGSIKGRPPLNAQFLFYLFLEAQNCDAMVGDLEERYRLIHKKFGHRRAAFWYWTQVIRSVGPIVWAAIRKLSGLAALVELYRRIRH